MGYLDYDKNFFRDFNHGSELYHVTNKKIPIWLLPRDIKAKEFDSDGSKWIEEMNRSGENELDSFVKHSNCGNVNLEKYTMNVKTTKYSDALIYVESTTPKYTITQKYSLVSDGVTVTVKDKSNRLVAEKIYNMVQDDGRKVLYLHGTDGKNNFTVVKIYSYKPSVNRASDVVNFAFTSNEERYVSSANFEREVYMLNGKEVKAKQIDENTYKVKLPDGKKAIFKVN